MLKLHVAMLQNLQKQQQDIDGYLCEGSLLKTSFKDNKNGKRCWGGNYQHNPSGVAGAQIACYNRLCTGTEPGKRRLLAVSGRARSSAYCLHPCKAEAAGGIIGEQGGALRCQWYGGGQNGAVFQNDVFPPSKPVSCMLVGGIVKKTVVLSTWGHLLQAICAN